MFVDPINAIAEVAYQKGSIYRYTNVSRRAILNLLLNPLTSLGFWVNHNLKNGKAKQQGQCVKIHPYDSLLDNPFFA